MRAWIEKRLADAGIQKDHIAFMRDHKQHSKKERLFSDMREGKKRILIGGKEMETGVNVQAAMHLPLDAPWKFRSESSAGARRPAPEQGGSLNAAIDHVGDERQKSTGDE